MCTVETLTRLALKNLPEHQRPPALAPEDDLRELGMDSLGYAAFIGDVERVCDVRFTSADLDAEAFRSVLATMNSVSARRGGPQP